MKGKFWRVEFWVIAFVGIALSGFSQSTDTSSFKIFLIGDAGVCDTSGATLLDLQSKLKDSPNSAVVFLGDNCYKKIFFGLFPLEIKGYDGGKKTRSRMMSQLNILRNYNGSAYFVPGNHDWWNTMKIKKGKKHLLKEQMFVEDSLRKFTTLRNYNDGTFLPVNGDAGPVSKSVNDGKIRIVFIDTYRLILEEGKKHRDTTLLETFYRNLENEITDATAKHQSIVLAGHHPMQSVGKHSQPLMFVEKLGKRFATSNSNYPPYHTMVVRINSLLKKYNSSSIYYASGHEHSLEYFYKDSIHYIVSGSGSKIDKVEFESRKTDTECVQWNQGGFFEIDFIREKGKVIMYHRENEKSELKETIIYK